MIVPPQAGNNELVSRFDGFLFSGGGDFAPHFYPGEKIGNELRDTDEERDEFEINLLRFLWEKDLPVLGICRGMQAMNLALGGGLYQDLKSDNQNFFDHFLVNNDEKYHEVQIGNDSILAEITQEMWIKVNSRHHQGIKRLAAGLQAIAWSSDGLIEAFTAKEKRFWLGIQWHPENLFSINPLCMEIFRVFIRACG